jgi:hypothetical protein
MTVLSLSNDIAQHQIHVTCNGFTLHTKEIFSAIYLIQNKPTEPSRLQVTPWRPLVAPQALVSRGPFEVASPCSKLPSVSMEIDANTWCIALDLGSKDNIPITHAGVVLTTFWKLVGIVHIFWWVRKDTAYDKPSQIVEIWGTSFILRDI